MICEINHRIAILKTRFCYKLEDKSKFSGKVISFGSKDMDVLLVAVLLLVAAFFYRTRRRGTPIPGPWGLPIFGYVPFLGKDPHVMLQKLSEKYGSMFGLYLGRSYVVVVNDFVTAKELFNNPALLDRPPNFFGQIPDGAGLASINGEGWTEQRRYTMRIMRDLGLRASSWEKLVQLEVADLLDMLKESKGKPMDFEKPLAAGFINNILSMVTGQRLPQKDPGTDILNQGNLSFMKLNDQSGFITFFPFLFNLALKLGLLGLSDLVGSLKTMNSYIRKLSEDCKAKEGNFISDYFKEMEEKKKQGIRHYFNETNLIGNVQSLILAGTHTTKASTEWLLLAMAAYPDVQDKVHNELDTVLSEGELPVWDDRRKLPYCHAAIMEGQRWRTLVPLNLVHRSSEDIRVRDYVIPKNTVVITNLWAYHNDAKYWDDPKKFMPERFLAEDGKSVQKRENFAAFSMGKRSCPGEAVAYIEMFIYFTAIMQTFRVLPAEEGVPPDLVGISGLTYMPKLQKLRFVPRK